MDTKQIFENRLYTIKNAVTGKNPIDRIPLLSNVWTWKYLDAGYTISESLYNYDIMEKGLRHYFDTYDFDVAQECGWRNPVQVEETLGPIPYVINDEISSISIKDQCFMGHEDYDELIKDPKKYIWETFIPRKHTALKNPNNVENFKNFLNEYGKFGAFLGKIGGMMTEEYGSPQFIDFGMPFGCWDNGIELLFCSLRGIKGLAMDIRRDPNKVEAAIEAINNYFIYEKMASSNLYKGSCSYAAFDALPVMFAQSILSAKQFEKFYWPFMQKIISYVEDYDKIGVIYLEGENKRFFDFFKDIKPGYFAIHSELNEVAELKKEFSNMARMGGLKLDLLGYATPEKCVEETKRIIDECGDDKKLLLMEYKMVSFPNDVKAENYKAVTDFIANYRI